jgi:16S rRNA processing protein RimM
MDTIQIGYTRKPHALKGEIKLQIEEAYLEDLLETDVILLDIKGQQMPYFIEDIRVGNAIIAKFETIDTPEAATAIANKALFLRNSDILADEEREFEPQGLLQFARCVGYTIYNGDAIVAPIEEVLEFPQQEMAVVTYQEREVLIPLHEAFIKNINAEEKIIVMELPEGLLEL